MGTKESPSATYYQCCCPWALKNFPKDVPKGHLVVYVGEGNKRFVIKVSLLKHPLFKGLLDQAKDEYGFSTTHSKLRIPCNENIFLDVVRCCTNSRMDRRIWRFWTI
ncbi:hypothetical protein NE237_010901 [Protea cynaroides]|uniref:Small auxin up regulated protein n=1 Tax=Protea cynaroides TaxID=273540 RepID=A0A9Q0L1I2_9MAGN|nr:hypothetical protein NE237_010901 [Protea cynaroides]